MPQFDTVPLPPRLPLVVKTSNRDGTFNKDARLVNCYLETDEQGELWLYKRAGLIEALDVGTNPGQGVFYWDGDVYSIFNGSLFRNGVSVPGGSGLDQTNGVYWFSSIRGAVPKMVFGNGAKTYAYDVVGGVTADLHSIDIDFPATTVKGIAYLNGATYVMNSNAEIWGSVVNSVSVDGDWSALDFINAQIEPDPGVALQKQLVYIIAFGSWSTEVFFDAGNPTGTPLGPVQGSKISYGCEHADSVQRIDDMLFWLSTSQTAAVQISVLEQLTHRVISTKPIDRLLQASDLSTVYSWQIKINGHNFYVITIVEANLTLAYDISEDLWHQWTDTNGNYMPIIASTYDDDNRHVLQHATNGKLYYADADYYTDAGDRIFVDIYTPIFDANTARRKHMNLMRFVGDQERGSVLQVRFSDNDYKSWSNFRSVRLDTKKPSLTKCGTFTRRAYHFRHWSNTPLRMQAVDVQYDLGTL
jgi:Phage stabilisation protein.